MRLKNLVANNLQNIYEKIEQNQRLDAQDGLKLYDSTDLISIGALARFAMQKRLKSNAINNVYWIKNHHLNLTNICEGSCKFCAYRRDEDQEGAFFLEINKAVEYLKNKVSKDVSEIHIVSGLNPKCDLQYYKKLFSTCRDILPKTHIQALTAVEVDYIAKLSNLTIEQTLKELVDSGLGSIPGGGAEIFSQSIRQSVCPEKISGKAWLDIMETAHKLGIKSNVTMLTGIKETPQDKIDHMIKTREVQDRTGGFMTFIPLFCHYENTQLEGKNEQTGMDILKEYAISRLMMDNIDHIKAFWIQIGLKMAQLSLAFGVDDLDGTVVEEKITHYAGAKTGQAISQRELIELIKNAGKTPVQRDTLYNLL